MYGANQLARENQIKANQAARQQQIESSINNADVAKYNRTGQFFTPDERSNYGTAIGGADWEKSSYKPRKYQSVDSNGNLIED
jgi:hypothetical protein